MLRVAIVNRHPADAIGGSELQCDQFARGLTERGHVVTYVALHAARPSAEHQAPGYALERVDPLASRDASAVATAIRRARPDVVYWRYGRELLDVVTGRLAQGHDRIPVVLAVAHMDDVERWPTGPVVRGGVRDVIADLRRRIEHRRSWRAFRHIAAIAAQREDFVGRAPVAIQAHVPNVVDPAHDMFDWPRPYVAWVANLKARKRPEQLAPLARALADHGIDLLVAGALQDERYRALSAADAAVPNLHPLGALEPTAAAGLIAGARCLAVTARPEGLSNAMIQAWWHGVPTVSLDYDPDGAIAQFGLGVVGGGEERFRAAVVDIATSPTARATAGRRAADYARRRFDRSRNVALLEELLDTVVTAWGTPQDPGGGPSARPM